MSSSRVAYLCCIFAFVLILPVSISMNLSFTCRAISSSSITFLTAETAQVIDEVLMTQPGFSLDQLMELAGLAVATAIMDFKEWVPSHSNIVLITCGPGNNGGDGLVAARHLKHFGLNPVILYPKKNKAQLFTNLVQQCDDLGIPFVDALPSDFDEFTLIVDAIFGFSFKGPTKEPFTEIINRLSSTSVPTFSIDVPSGWDVEQGDIFSTKFYPSGLISLTLPKLCVQNYNGIHYIGGRFVPPKITQMYGLKLPDYGIGSSQIVRIIT